MVTFTRTMEIKVVSERKEVGVCVHVSSKTPDFPITLGQGQIVN